MKQFPDDVKYTATHEWIRVDGNGVATVGISHHAQEALGDIVFVELPEPGAEARAGGDVAVIESVKAASDIYSPVSGEILEVNGALSESPETVNGAPYGDGWLFRIALRDPADLAALMDAEAYSKHCGSG